MKYAQALHYFENNKITHNIPVSSVQHGKTDFKSMLEWSYLENRCVKAFNTVRVLQVEDKETGFQ